MDIEAYELILEALVDSIKPTTEEEKFFVTSLSLVAAESVTEYTQALVEANKHLQSTITRLSRGTTPG